MKKWILGAAALACAGLCLAQETGRVLSSTPIIQQVGTQRQVCGVEQAAVQSPKSGAGAVLGAIAGGAMGNAVGGGAGKAAATMLGLVGGAVIGDNIEGGSQVQNVQRCRTQVVYENRPVAYNVVYEYAGKQYTVQLPNDPGPALQLQLSPVNAVAQMAPPQGTVVYEQPVYGPPIYAQPATVVYPGYYQPNYAVPLAIGIGLGYWGGNSGHSYGRGRWH